MKHAAYPYFTLLAVACFSAKLPAQTSYPMIMSLHPVAVQVGQTSEHTIKSRYSMFGANKVLVTGDGVTGEIVHPEIKEDAKDKEPNLQTMKVRFKVAPEAKPGVRDFRIATPQGASTLGQLVIVRDALVSESGKNNSADEAQAINVPCTVCGAIEKAEDVDFYKFSVEAGQAFTFHVRSMRLQNKIHDLQQHSDPILTIRNAAGVTLAASDNYFFADPLVSYTFEHAGQYLLEIRDVRFQGNQYWEYCIEISGRPLVTNVFPMGISPGETTKLELVGFQLPEKATAELQPPMNLPSGAQWLQAKLGNELTNPVPVVACQLPLIRETSDDNNSPDTAQSVEIECGINGWIERQSDIDCYAFDAKKGERFSFEVIARRQQSALDSHLRILNQQGKQLQVNDDLRIGKRNFADSWVEGWTAPADGKYIIEIRDLHLRGGPEFVYFLKATRAAPYFELYADTDKTQLTPGTSGVLFVRVVRKNGFKGQVQLHVDGLPDKVTAHCGRILADKGQDGCIVLTAARDAPAAITNITVSGKAIPGQGEDADDIPLAIATAYQETYQPGGGRGHWPVQMQTVSVAAPSDIRAVKLSTYEITLKPGESAKIDVTIQRAEGFDKNVTLDVIYKHLNGVYGDSLPKGVTVDAKNSKTLLTGKTAAGYITLTAAKDAPPVEKQQIAVMANVSLNFVMKATYSSEPVFVTVAAP